MNRTDAEIAQSRPYVTRGHDAASCGARRLILLSVAMWLGVCAVARAQTPEDEWVDQANRKIDAVRKTDVRVIVFDGAGRPASGAAVRIEQLRHAFTLGAVLGESGFPQRGDGPVWRCFNAVSLERFTDWSRLADGPLDEPDFTRIDDLVAQAQDAGLTVRWGPLISADLGRNPPWLAFLEGDKLAAALEDHVRRVLLRYGRRVDAFDLYTHSLDHAFVQEHLGMAMVRQLHEHARAAAPQAVIGLRLENSLVETRLRRAVQHAEDFRQKFVPFGEVVIPQRFGGLLLHRRLSHGLELLGQLAAPITIGPLEVGGSSDAAAAHNLETLLRLVFGIESVRGIYIAGLTMADVADPTAALLDDVGSARPPGDVFDTLFRRTWWTDETHQADELGNVYARVFAGTHRISATLTDGRELSMTVHLSKDPPRGLAQHVVLLEPRK